MIELFKAGGPVMWPLLLCSILSLTIIIERVFFWVSVNLNQDSDLLNEVMELSRQGEWEQVRKKAMGSNNYIIRVLVSGILHREYSMLKAMESASAEEIGRMRRFMGILDTMITAAPLIGILGTVVGIIVSFESLGTTGIEHPEAVTKGISQALITTASGLGIAVFVIFPYNFFQSRVEKAAQVIEKYATSLEIVYEKLHPASNQSMNEKHEGKPEPS